MRIKLPHDDEISQTTAGASGPMYCLTPLYDNTFARVGRLPDADWRLLLGRFAGTDDSKRSVEETFAYGRGAAQTPRGADWERRV